MKKLFFDTNVVLDFCLQSRDGHHSARKIIEISVQRKQSLVIAWHTLSVLEYVGKRILKEEVYPILQNVASLFEIPLVGSQQAQSAFEYLSGDYEDAMQIISALEANADVILTTDVSGGFDKSPVPIMTPKIYLDCTEMKRKR
jgi:predicted nucleic acid-binding protein